MFYLSRPYPFKFFKGCLPQILLGPFLNTLSHISDALGNNKKFISEICSYKTEVFSHNAPS